MARKKDSPQKAAHREMMVVIPEGALDEELDEELGYSRYDYRNKETNNSRNGHSQKTMHTSYWDMELDIPRDRKVVILKIFFTLKIDSSILNP